MKVKLCFFMKVGYLASASRDLFSHRLAFQCGATLGTNNVGSIPPPNFQSKISTYMLAFAKAGQAPMFPSSKIRIWTSRLMWSLEAQAIPVSPNPNFLIFQKVKVITVRPIILAYQTICKSGLGDFSPDSAADT